MDVTNNGARTLREIADTFAELGGRLSSLAAERTPDAIVRFAADTVPGTDSASLTLMHEQRFTTMAATDDRAREADQLQYRLGSGPCVDAIVDHTIYAPADLAKDTRWPVYGKQVSKELGVNSMLSYRLAVEVDGVVSGLNMYGSSPGAFGDEDLQLGLLLAAHASLAVRAALNEERAENLERALQNSRDIGVGIGVLMSQYTLTRQQAFDLLRLASQRTNRKLRDIARDVADTGVLEVPHAGRNPQA